MANKDQKHWTTQSTDQMASRVASDFLSQIEEKIAEADWSHTDLAEALGVTKGRISQVFNNPGNLTLKTMLKLAEAAKMLEVLEATRRLSTRVRALMISSAIPSQK